MANRTISCPQCRAKLKPAKAPAPGKRIRCPICGSAFVAGGHEPAEAPFAEEDPYDDAPRSAARRSGGRRRKRKSSVSLKVPLIILGAAIVLVGVGLGIAIVVKHLPDDLSDSINLSNLAGDLGIGGEIDFTYMPAGTTQIGLVRPRALWNSSIAEELRDAAQAEALLTSFEDRFGLSYTDIETVTLFLGGPGGSVHVVELSDPASAEAITSRIPGVEAVTHGASTYYRLPDGQAALHFVSATTILVAPESMVTSVIDGTFTGGDSTRFAFADGGADLLDATSRIDHDWLWSQLNNHPSLQMLRGGAQEFNRLHGNGIVALSDGVRLSGSAEYRQVLRFASAEAATQAAAWLEEQFANERTDAAAELAEIDSRLAAAREAEQERVEQARSGRNPFAGGNQRRASDVEEQHERQQRRLAALKASDVSRSGDTMTLVTRLTAEDLADQEILREQIASARVVSSLSESLGWTPASRDAPVTTTAGTTATPVGNQQRVFQFTYNIVRYARPDTAALEKEVEEALLRVSSYVPESASVNVAQARISFQVTNGFHNTDAVIQLQRAGLILDAAPVREEELMREVPQRTADNIRVEFEVVSVGPREADRTPAADQMLRTMPGYVAGSVAIDEDGKRLTAEFTSQPNAGQIMTMLRGAGLVVQPAGSESSARGPVGMFCISVYYASYSGDGPVGEAARRMVEDLPGYVAGSLEHDEAAHYLTFRIEARHPTISVRQALLNSGFRSHAMMAGSEPTPVEELRDVLQGGRERASDVR